MVLAILGMAWYIPQIHLKNAWTAVWVVLVLSILNVLVKPLLILLTIPITLLTLGLFLLIINTFLVFLTENLISGFMIDGFLWTFIFALLVSFVNYLISQLIRD